MSIKVKNQMSEIMTAAWSFVRKNGYTMAEALKCAWANFKLRKAMATKIVRFYFRKVDGSIREAFGTLAENIVPPTNGTDRKKNETIQTYYDSEKEAWRCFKKANLISVNL